MDQPTLVYSYDPLCGWCYGFHPVLEKITKRFENDLEIKVIPGGLAVDENAETIAEGYSYIKGSLKQIEKTTGIQFGDNFKLLAEEGSYLYDSEPSCIAQTVVNKIAPDYALEFAGLMQYSLFQEGKSLNDWETFKQLIARLQIDTDEAEKLYQSESIRQETREQFEWCKQNGAASFPTLLLKIGDEFGVMSRGFRPYDTIESHLHHILNNFRKLMS